MDATQEGQTGRRERVKREAWQIRQSEGNKAARRLFTASPTIRGACGIPFGMLSQLLLKTGLLWNCLRAENRGEINFPHRSAAWTPSVYTRMNRDSVAPEMKTP
jgi:hypothetical protein